MGLNLTKSKLRVRSYQLVHSDLEALVLSFPRENLEVLSQKKFYLETERNLIEQQT